MGQPYGIGNQALLIVDHYSQRGRIGRYPLTLIGFAAAVILCLALSAWFVIDQRAVPNHLPNRIDRQPIIESVNALVIAPEALRPVSTQEAEALNAAMPVSAAPNPAARAMYIPLGDGTSLMRSLDCLTAAIYYEAANEGTDGQRAVAQVILNRARHPAFPHSICGVVFQGSERKTGCQFTFTCDGSLMRIPSKSGWARARAVADAALAGYVYGPVGWATHYHAGYVAPYWAPTLAKAAVIGAHIFYRWPGGWGRPSAFTSRYAGTEPLIDLANGKMGSQLPGMPTFIGAIDPNAPAVAATPEIPVARSVLPFAARAAVASGTASMPAAEAPRPALPSNRWVIGARPAATDKSAPPAAATSPQDAVNKNLPN